MSMVKVFNYNKHPYQEKFEDSVVKIPPGQFVEMDREKAVKLMGTYAPPILGVDGEHKPEGYKMLKIIRDDSELEARMEQGKQVNELQCIACSYEATSKTDLGEHMKANHAAQAVKDEEAEKAAKVNSGSKTQEVLNRKRARPRTD